MNNNITFEYYSTFAPVSDTFTAINPQQHLIETDTDLMPLQLTDNSYTIYSRIVYKPIITINSHYFK